MNEADRDLLYIVAFFVFFPWSLIFLIARWLIRRAKARPAKVSDL